MPLENINRWLSLLANLGVIAGIVFLAIEIRNTATQAGTSATQAMVVQVVDWQYRIASDESLAEIYEAGLGDFENLSTTDQVRFDALMRSLLQVTYSGISARNAVFLGEPPPLKERALEGNLFRHLGEPGFRQWWSNADRRGLPAQLQRLMDELDQVRD